MQIIGHRGARGEAPENTLGGFQYLNNLGIRAVEFDVRQLKNGKLVVIHDADFLRTTGKVGSIYDCTDAGLNHFDHSQHWTKTVWSQAEYTPTLGQVLDIVKQFNHIEVEVKAVDTQDEAIQLVEKLQLALTTFQQQVVITSFDLKIHKALQQQRSTFKRGLLVETDLKEKAIELALHYGCKHIGWMDQLATLDILRISKEAKLSISVWTVNDVQRAKQLQDAGIQGLITDYPQLMLTHL